MRSLIAVRAIAFAVAVGFAAVAAPARADQLVMFQLKGCPYCRAWDTDIGRSYAKTDEGKRLPLRRVDVLAARPPDLRSIAKVRYTPTFIVTHCGREVRRIEGYGGQEQFWSLLDSALAALDEARSARRGACPE